MRPESFYLHTLGCKINQYEGQALREAWLGAGMIEAEGPEAAGVVVINSCAVTERALQDVRKASRRFQRLNPSARQIVTGCAAALLDPAADGLPERVWLVPQTAKPGLLDLVAGPGKALEPEARPGFPDFHISGFARTRAVLKVQDGCSRCCAYCIVPRTRGGSRSRPVAAILAEAQRLIQAGHSELVVSGIDLAQFQGDERQVRDVWDLVARLDRLVEDVRPGAARLRLSSLDPGLLTDRAAQVLAGAASVCPHLHLSVQSASPGVLGRMGRDPAAAGKVQDFVRRMAAFWPVAGLGGDFLVGFPGETEAEFQETRELVAELPFTYAHVFSFSPRPGTRAAGLEGRVAPEASRERSRILRQLAAAKRQRFLERLAGLSRVAVLLEQPGPGGKGQGLTEHYASCRLESTGQLPEPGQILTVRPLGWEEQGLLAEWAQVSPAGSGQQVEAAL